MGRGVSNGGGQSSLGYLFGSDDESTKEVPARTKPVQNPTPLVNEAPQKPKAVSSKSPENGIEEYTQYSRATLSLKFKSTEKWALLPKPSFVAAVQSLKIWW